MSKTLNWNDRFALIDRFKPTDDKICEAFNVDHNALDVARNLRQTGHFVSSQTIDVEAYSHLFGIERQKPTSTSTKIIKPSNKPLTATKKKTVPQKRGRKGSKIKDAFHVIPASPIDAEQFAAEHNVSVAVLRQSKRFDPVPNSGPVHVRKIELNGEKTLCIWRENV